MFGLATRGLSLLFTVALVAVALAWQFAVDHPALAISIGSLTVSALCSISIARRRRLDAQMRDEHVPSMSPTEYEQFNARLLERAGWRVRHCGHTGDQGCDVVAEIRGFKAVVQCKLYRSRVGNGAVQEAVAARRHYGAQIMVVVAPAGFTQSAQALAASNGVHLLHHSALHTLAGLARIP